MKRNWTSWAALTVVVVGGILWALAPNAGMLPYNIPDPSNEAVGPFKECQLPRKQLGASSKSGVTAPTASAEEGPDSVSCQQAINSAQREKQDLAAQWTAATANRNAVAIAERQMRWSVLEFFALIGTLTFAYIAISDGRKHSVAELRAYVSIKDRVLSRLYIGQHARVDFKIFNAGTTPAHNMRYRAALEVFDVPFKGDIKSQFGTPAGEIPPLAVIHPQESHEAEAIQHKPFTAVEWAGICSGAWGLYLVCDVEYDDAFGNSRLTKFCAWIGGPEFAETDASARKAGIPKTDVVWILTADHNTAT